MDCFRQVLNKGGLLSLKEILSAPALFQLHCSLFPGLIKVGVGGRESSLAAQGERGEVEMNYVCTSAEPTSSFQPWPLSSFQQYWELPRVRNPSPAFCYSFLCLRKGGNFRFCFPSSPSCDKPLCLLLSSFPFFFLVAEYFHELIAVTHAGCGEEEDTKVSD